MDRQKIRELLKQTHPKHKVAEQNDESRYAADSSANDVDVKDLSPTTWRKFETAPAGKPSASSSTSSDLRERFRPRALTGAGSGSGKPPDDSARGSARSAPGKVTLERLVRDGGPADTDDTLDVIVDEEHGVIGESDSGPEED